MGRNNNTREEINEIVDLIVNLENYEKVAKRYYDRYVYLNKYSDIDNKVEKEKRECYKEYSYYNDKVNDINNMLRVLREDERRLLLDWYTIPVKYRQKAENFAEERFMSRRTFFRVKQEALKKLRDYFFNI